MNRFDAIVVGGGIAGLTATAYLARAGKRVAMIDRGGRIKPCGGAIRPPASVPLFPASIYPRPSACPGGEWP